MSTSSSPKPLKPRRMWVDPELYALPGKDANVFSAKRCFPEDVQVAVIPLDDVDGLVQKARKAYYAEGPDYRGNGIRAALAAIGVPPKPRAKKGGRK